MIQQTPRVRKTTALERAAGISDTHVLVTKNEGTTKRLYGCAISLN